MRHMQRDYKPQASVISAMQQENEDLLSMKANGRKFDSARSHSVGVMMAGDATQQFTASAQAFIMACLPTLPSVQQPHSQKPEHNYALIKERVYGIGD